METNSLLVLNAEMAVTFWAGLLLNKGIPALTESTVEINGTALRSGASNTLLRTSFLPRYQNCKVTLAGPRVWKNWEFIAGFLILGFLLADSDPAE